MRSTLIALTTGAALLATPAVAYQEDTELHTVKVETVASGLDHPWGLAFLPDGRMLVTEREGALRLVSAAGEVGPPLGGVPEVAAFGQGGLLDVILDPDHEANGVIYLSYAARGDGGYGTRVARARLAGDRLTDVQVIFDAEPKSRGGRHFGSRLVFDREGFLFITQGDRGDRPRAQDPTDHAGALMRIRPDGGIPADNPFHTGLGGHPEIYSYGHRNPQGMALHPETGRVWLHEHGPRGGDEVNIPVKGGNFGWPVLTFGIGYDGSRIGQGTRREGMEDPIHQWTPSIAPSGMAFYTGAAFPQWRGDLFVGALKDRMVVRLKLDGERVVREERMLENLARRIRDVRDGPDGYLYLLTDHRDGEILRMVPGR